MAVLTPAELEALGTRPGEKPPEPAPASRVLALEDVPSTETMVESAIPGGAAAMTPVQRAIARVADGVELGALWSYPDVRAAFGGAKPPPVAPRTMVVIAGTRGAKSIFAAARAVRSALLCDLSVCSPGDEIRLPCLATTEKQAGYIYKHALTLFQRYPGLLRTLAKKPLTTSFLVSREDGLNVAIETQAMTAKGNGVVGSWLAGINFDEAPRLGCEEETVRSLEAARDAASDRILGRGQELLIGSPHAPYGVVFELHRERFGRPDEDVVVVQASGPMLNPVHWTPERLERLKRTNLFAYITSGLARFADPDSTLIPSRSIELCMSQEERHPRRWASEAKRVPVEYVACLAPGERGAGWTLTVVGTLGRDEDGQKLYEEAVSQQWFETDGGPLQPRAVLKECRDICAEYGVDAVHVRNTFAAGLYDIADALDFGLIAIELELEQRIEFALLLRAAIVERRIVLTSNRQQYTDLQRVQKKPTVNGTTVQFQSSGEDLSCDFVPPLGACLLVAPEPPEVPATVELDAMDEHLQAMRDGGDAWEQALGRLGG